MLGSNTRWMFHFKVNVDLFFQSFKTSYQYAFTVCLIRTNYVNRLTILSRGCFTNLSKRDTKACQKYASNKLGNTYFHFKLSYAANECENQPVDWWILFYTDDCLIVFVFIYINLKNTTTVYSLVMIFEDDGPILFCANISRTEKKLIVTSIKFSILRNNY